MACVEQHKPGWAVVKHQMAAPALLLDAGVVSTLLCVAECSKYLWKFLQRAWQQAFDTIGRVTLQPNVP